MTQMKIEVVDLKEENLTDTPEWESHPYSCKYCIYWEFPEACVDPTEKKEELIRKKLEWLRNTRKAFGNCGRIIYVNERPVGYAQYALPQFLPHSTDYQSGPPSKDAVLISCLFIPPRELRRTGLGSRLLQSISNDLRKRGVKAVETFARKSVAENPSGPMQFYVRHGFKICRDDREFPLMRLEL